MTVGQRIAQKRKELALTQEQLGEQLGVSRQAIYKWESDAALPEVEKLVALSRLFRVPVGWLLGVEESVGAEQATAELTEEQLRMVQEIVDRYLAARPEPVPVRPRRWPRVVGALAILAAVFAGVKLGNELKNVRSTVNGLQSSVNYISGNVASQIGSITQRVEELLKGQNNLTAEYGTEPVSSDLTAGTVTFTASAVPKTYVAGMEATFVARSGEESVTFPGQLGEGNRFSAEVTCPLSDSIVLSVVFTTAGKEETQLLDRYDWLLSATVPDGYVSGRLWRSKPDQNGVLTAVSGDLIAFEPYSGETADWFAPAEFVSVRVGLFRDQELVYWYDETDQPQGYSGSEDWYFFRSTRDVTLETGAVYTDAAVAVDSYGRTWVFQDTPVIYNTDTGELDMVGSYDWRTSAEGWKF